jgi:hypothetical protein
MGPGIHDCFLCKTIARLKSVIPDGLEDRSDGEALSI